LGDFVLHQDIDIVITPMAIDVQKRFAQSLIPKTQTLNESIAWFIFGANRNLNPMQLLGEK
jgi:hypothetical protein